MAEARAKVEGLGVGIKSRGGSGDSKGIMQTLKSYFFWTHQRGSFHYDVMVTLILAFIFIAPQFVKFGDKAPSNAALRVPVQVVGDGEYGLVVTVPVEDVAVEPNADDKAVRKALHVAMQPVTGDAVSVVRWETVADANGKPMLWKVWVHR